MLLKKIDDYVLATGKSTSLKNVIKIFFKKQNLNYINYIKINKKNFRQHDIKENYANISKIKQILKIKPVNSFKNLIDLI